MLTHDGTNLIAAAGGSVLVLDTGRLNSGDPEPVVARIKDDGQAGSIYVNVTADDKILFVSNESSATISVIDLEPVRTDHGFDARAVIGRIPVGVAPIALTFSPDERWLYTTSEVASRDWNWPVALKPEDAGPEQVNRHAPAGAVLVVDVARARIDPATFGDFTCSSRFQPGADSHRARRRASLCHRPRRKCPLGLRHREAPLRPGSCALARETVGAAPVPVAVIQEGKTVVVGNSNRFNESSKAETLTVLDASRLGHAPAVIGTIPCGSFPREMRVSADGKTLCVTNFRSSTLEIIDARLRRLRHARVKSDFRRFDSNYCDREMTRVPLS